MSTNNYITFLIAKRTKQQSDFFDTFDLASNFKTNSNVVVLEDTRALRLVLENMPDNASFKLLIHANIGEGGKEEQTRKLKTSVDDVQSISGCENITPFFITRSSEIEQLCIKEQKCFVTLNGSNVKCTHTSKLSDRNFSTELTLFFKEQSGSILNSIAPPKQKIFIGSSTVGLPYAESVKSVLESKIKYESVTKNKFDIDVWNTVFKDNNTTIEKLEEIINIYKYSIFIFSPDDTVKMSGSDDEKKIPRDNVIFEYGLFMGKSGRPNTFPIVPDNYNSNELRILSDISGLNLYKYTDNENKDSAVGTPVKNIFDNIKKDSK